MFYSVHLILKVFIYTFFSKQHHFGLVYLDRIKRKINFYILMGFRFVILYPYDFIGDNQLILAFRLDA